LFILTITLCLPLTAHVLPIYRSTKINCCCCLWI